MDVLAHALERDLPLVAEGIALPNVAPRQRRRTGLGFADLYIRGLDYRTDATLRWRGVSRTHYYFTPYELSPDSLQAAEGAANLAARLRITESVILDWHFDRVAPPVLLEELHTAAELVLEHLVNRRSKRLSFAELVAAADAQSLLAWPLPDVAQCMGAPRDPAGLLIELKDHRKEARHRANRDFEPWLADNWEAIVLLLERIVRRLAVRRDT